MDLSYFLLLTISLFFCLENILEVKQEVKFFNIYYQIFLWSDCFEVLRCLFVSPEMRGVCRRGQDSLCNTVSNFGTKGLLPLHTHPWPHGFSTFFWVRWRCMSAEKARHTCMGEGIDESAVCTRNWTLCSLLPYTLKIARSQCIWKMSYTLLYIFSQLLVKLTKYITDYLGCALCYERICCSWLTD